MKKKDKKKTQQSSFLPLILFFPFLALLIIVVWLLRNDYYKCLFFDVSMCFSSKKFVSPSKKFTFRYPSDYPIHVKTEEELTANFSNQKESVILSQKFNPYDEESRLGEISISKKTHENFKTFYDDFFGRVKNPEVTDIDRGHVAFPITNNYYEAQVDDESALCEKEDINSIGNSSSKRSCFVVHNAELYELSFSYNDFYFNQFPKGHYDKGKQIILDTFHFLQ